MVCIISHIATASTDAGYLNKKDALKILDEIIDYVKQCHDSWDKYGSRFMEGQSEVGLNNFIGNSVLNQY